MFEACFFSKYLESGVRRWYLNCLVVSEINFFQVR